MGSHIAAVAAGRRDYRAVPVFLSRSFRHANLYIRTDRGIAAPEDLAGKTIGLVDYQQTAALWLRGLLADEHGVARESVRWVAAGLHAPMLQDRTRMSLPAGIRLERSPSTLDALLAEGTIDAVISPGAPRCFLRQSAPVARMWPEPRPAEIAYWQRTRLFPIMHVLVVRRTLVNAAPDLPDALYAAFEGSATAGGGGPDRARFSECRVALAVRSRAYGARGAGRRSLDLWAGGEPGDAGDDAALRAGRWAHRGRPKP